MLAILCFFINISIVFNFSHPVSGNSEFAFNLALWTFKQKGVLRVAGVEHHRVGEETPPAAYTIEDKVVCIYLKFSNILKNVLQLFQDI